MSARRRVVVLGATGSIGASTLDVLARHPDRYAVHALTAHRDVDALVARSIEARPRYAVIADPARLDALARGLREADLATQALAGEPALAGIASDAEADVVVAAIVGAAGLRPTLAAAHAG
ncbi:MAG TPA: 1-deoxy-D-xylulose-5-phosphate reductoisomerase, partial [Xanthomonadales bacterium]|nr:1-deoxy-D-xylulose-5-phosphate reductoisomerase [Xanthomonadales bacterium]